MLIVRSIDFYPSGEELLLKKRHKGKKGKKENVEKKVPHVNLQDVHKCVSLIQQEGIRQSRDSSCSAKLTI